MNMTGALKQTSVPAFAYREDGAWICQGESVDICTHGYTKEQAIARLGLRRL